ncbi:hypothetical protein OG792_31740 [Micromonospora sp. NBC_01699]|uniref:hypothetical protein n=1 Tax=Micromonospora sp. NBC_01699 TaxID=2975984 RepID=UPI002E291215|nr:hypothetical protein [Micromonospora sp. NBC_01699]
MLTGTHPDPSGADPPVPGPSGPGLSGPGLSGPGPSGPGPSDVDTPAGVDRGVDVLLAVGTAAVLAVGGWWWAASAPTPTGPVAAPRTASPVVPPDLAYDSYDSVDPETGAMVPDAGRGLPEFPGTVRRDQFAVHEGTIIDWPVQVESGARYLLQYVCDGPGELTIRVDGTRTGFTEMALVCGDGFASTAVTAAGTRMGIQVSRARPQPGPVEVAIQLLALS